MRTAARRKGGGLADSGVKLTNVRGQNIMKATLYAALAGALFVAALPVEANAVVCARGVYRAGCAGPHGAVVAPRGAAVVTPRCVYRAGVRVCR